MRPFQILGIMTVVFAFVLFLAGVFAPVVYSPLELPEDFVQPEDIADTTGEKDAEPKKGDEMGEVQKEVESSERSEEEAC